MRQAIFKRLLAWLAIFACGAAELAADAPFRDCPGCPEMLAIPGGQFRMGAAGGEAGRPEGPVRTVHIRAFALGRYEITQAEYARFVAAAGHAPLGGCRVWPDERMTDQSAFDWRNPGYAAAPSPRHPAACISWLDAWAYAAWLAQLTGKPYRLPSEAEWEYAARAGAQTAYPWGEDPAASCRYANIHDRSGAANGFPWAQADCDDGHPQAAPVGSFPGNAFGLHDLIGNVWEWTADCYVPFYRGAPRDGSAHVGDGSCARRAIRGGSWITRPSRNRLSFRGRDPEATVYFMFGFRVARDLEESDAWASKIDLPG